MIYKLNFSKANFFTRFNTFKSNIIISSFRVISLVFLLLN
jgi:hypothetical protein